MKRKPAGDLFLRDFSCGQSKDHLRCVTLRSDECPSVQSEKEHRCNKSRSFVAIDEGMITSDPKTVSRRQSGSVRDFFVMEKIPRPRQGGFEETLVSNAIETNM